MPDPTFIAVVAVVAVGVAVFGIDRILKASRKVGRATKEFQIGQLEGELEYRKARAELEKQIAAATAPIEKH